MQKKIFGLKKPPGFAILGGWGGSVILLLQRAPRALREAIPVGTRNLHVVARCRERPITEEAIELREMSRAQRLGHLALVLPSEEASRSFDQLTSQNLSERLVLRMHHECHGIPPFGVVASGVENS